MRRRTLQNAGIEFDANGRARINGYEVIDLGLSDGLLFATCNVGATTETEYGDYYMCGKGSRKYNESDSIYKGTENPLASTADTATQVMGNGWRMPTKDEFQDLINKTNYRWTTVNGIKGGKFTSKRNSNAYVFFPAAGYYAGGNLLEDGIDSIVLSSTPRPSVSINNYGLFFKSGDKYVSDYGRSYGFSVRGVHAAV